jgi:hypothetical protein
MAEVAAEQETVPTQPEVLEAEDLALDTMSVLAVEVS